MKKIEFAHELLSESRRSTQLYLESGRDYHKVKAHMYSIFECYAHGLISWNQVRTRWHSSILEYLNLYADRPDLYLAESSRMLGEYEITLQTYKPALDEYKRVNEQKMTSNIVVKSKLNESQAKEQSNLYFNRRALNENQLNDTAGMKTWKQVQESYPNLTSKDELRIRMLTIFEGSTVDTTALVTTYMSEEPTAMSGPMQTSMRPKPRPATGNVDSASIDAAVQQALGNTTAPTTSPRPQPRPAAQSIGAGSQVTRMPNGSVDGSTRGIDPADAYSPEDLARLTGQPAPRLAPTTSPRPMPRPATLKQSANNNIRKEAVSIFNKIKATANEGYKVLPPMDKERYTEIPGLEGPFTTLSGKVVYYDPKEGAYYDRDTDMYLSNDEYTALNSDYSGMQDERDIKIREAKKVKPGHNARVMAKAQDTVRKSIEKSKKEDDDKKDKVDEAVAKIACVKCDEVSTAAAWKKNNGFCPKCKTSSHGVAESASKAASFKLKVTNPATGNSETQEFNSETALNAYKDRATQKGLKVSRVNNESVVNEAVTLDYSRYMRAHGKKPRDAGMGSSTWMFTTADFGDPSEDEIFQFQGSFADAKKAAAKWAKSQGEYRFYVMEKKNYNNSVKEADLDDGMSGFTPGVDTAPTNRDAAFRAAIRSAVDNITIGGGKYARAAADYGVKNLGSMAGISDPTSWETEINQEFEKDLAAQTNHPVAWDIGDKAATIAQVASGVGAAKALGTAALKAGLRSAAAKNAGQAIAKNAGADDFELGMRNALDLTPQMRVPPKPLNLTPQMQVPPKPLKLTPNQMIPRSSKIVPFPKKP
jgi:Zn finger protein HypA/HybF involved in hydrogenase expression